MSRLPRPIVLRATLRVLAALAVVAAAAAVWLGAGDGTPALPPRGPVTLHPAPAARAAAPAAPTRAARPRVQQRRARLPTGNGLRAVLRRAHLSGQVPRARWLAWRDDVDRARAAVGRLTGVRRAELASVLATTEGLAASGRLTASRMPLAFLTLRRNTAVWRLRPFPRPSQRLAFRRDPAVFQYFPGRGVQFHGLATAGRANAMAVPCLRAAEARAQRAVARASRGAVLRRSGAAVETRPGARPRAGGRTQADADGGRCRPAILARRLDRLVGLSSSRGGFRAWEHLFAYGGGTAPWVSAMTQATAAQALARGAVALGAPAYRRAALGALGAFDASPPVGVAVHERRARRFVMYSFAPDLRILNGFLQAVIGLHDVADLTGSARAARLYRMGERSARRSVTAYDTGAWSRYSDAGRESTLGYHQLVTGFLTGLCARTGRAPYCDRAERFDRYLLEPPRIVLRPPVRLREARPAALSVWVSKVSDAEVTVRDRHGIVLKRTGSFPRGRYRYAFVPPRSGAYDVRVTATGPEGRRAVERAEVRARISFERIRARRERAEAREERAEARQERAEARRERAEARQEGAEARPERAEARQEGAEARPERAEARQEGAEARPERAEARRKQAARGRERAADRGGGAPERTEDSAGG